MLQKPSIFFSVSAIVLNFLLPVSASFGQNQWLDETGAPITSIEHLILPYLDNQDLKDKHKFNDEEGSVPYVFAETIIQDIHTQDHGTWESTSNGHLLWRQRITSIGAYSLNLGFRQFHLPPSASLFVYDVGKTFVVGPITQEDNDIHEEWWTPIIPSDDIVIELQIAREEVNGLKLNLTAINHDFSGLGSVVSGSCNLDVICGAEDGFDIVDRFREVVDGVGMIMIEGRIQCTGTLINNTRKDCIPYVFTADHCGITQSSAPSVLIYWNFQNSECRLPDSQESGSTGDGIQNQFNSGSTLVAQYDQSDFTLIELDDPVDPDYNPYYVGWDNNTESVDTAFTIHHPTGDEKRISFDFDTLTFNVDRNFVRVADWDIGTTEVGSSGGPLLNLNAHIIGQLTGGDASCGNDEFDEYGMFKKSWEGGGTPETRLKDWLDPLNTGQNTLDGRYCTDVAILDVNRLSICSQTQTTDIVTISATAGYEEGGKIQLASAPDGLNVVFSDSTIRTNESVQVFIELTEQFVDQTGIISIIIENAQGPAEFQIEVNVFDDIPDIPELISPLDGTSGVDFEINFEWQATAPRYTLELSERPDFSEPVIRINDISTNFYTQKDLFATTTYYWRVRSDNVCGTSSYSSTNSFTTGTIVCLTRTPSDLPQEIGEEAVTITSVIVVEESGTVSDINVLNITGSHTWVSDLTMTLTSPSGTVVTLIETPCSDEDNFLVSFDDSSENINLDCPLTTGRRFKPVEDLAAFNGENAAGEWTLRVIDGVNLDGGSFDDWTLEICVNQTENKSFQATPSFIEICDKDPGPVTIDLFFNDAWTNPSNPLISTASGALIRASISPNPIGDTSQVTLNIEDPSELVGVDVVIVSFEDGDDVIGADFPVIHTADVTKPVLIAPSDGADQIELSPSFSWESGLDREGKHVVTLATDQEMMEVIATLSLSEDTLSLDQELEELTIYFWQVTAEGVCTDSTSTVFSFTTDRKVATIDESLSGIKIYPSPADDYLTIDLRDIVLRLDLRYELWTLDGRILDRGKLNQRIKEIQVGSHASGLYLLTLISQEGIFVHKVVVSH